MYTQTLCSIVPTQTDYATVKSKFPALKDTNVSGTLASQIQRMLDNIDTLSGAGSSKKLLDGAGIKASDIANLSPDDRTRLSEKVTNRYMSAIKEASGDTKGGFADVYGNYRDDPAHAADAGPGAVSKPASGSSGQVDVGAASRASGGTSGGDTRSDDPAGALVDLLMRSVAVELSPKPATSLFGKPADDGNGREPMTQSIQAP